MRVPQQPNYRFAVSNQTRDIPIELPERLSAVQEVYDKLSKLKSASGLNRGFINVSELVSSITNGTVLSIYTNDDEADLAVVSSQGRVTSINGRSGEGVIAYAGNGVADLRLLDDDHEVQLHQAAAEAFEEVFGIPGPSIGLGSFDPPQDYGFVEVRSAPAAPNEPSTPPETSKKATSFLRSLFGGRSS